MTSSIDRKTHQLAAEYQELLRREKAALVACPAAAEPIIAILFELQKPTHHRRIDAQQVARLVTGLTRGILPPEQLFSELLSVPMSMDDWNEIRRQVEHEPGELCDQWRKLLDDVSAVRNEIIIDYLYLAKRLAHGFVGNDSNLREDFENYAVIGLIRALDDFKPHLEIPFSTHAYNWMLSYLSKMSDRQRIVKPSEFARRILRRFKACKSEFIAKEKRAPTLAECAARMRVPLEKLVPIMEMSHPVLSLDQVVEEDGTTLHDLVASDAGVNPQNDLDDLRKSILKALSGLNPTERLFVAFYLEMNLNDVTAETAYSLAAAQPIIRQWAKDRLLELASERT